MITYDELKTKLVKNGWPEQSVARITAVSSSIGVQSLYYLFNNVDEFGVESSDRIASMVEQFKLWRSQIESGSPTDLPDALAKVVQSQNLLQTGLLSSFICDLHANPAVSARLDSELDRSLYLFQFSYSEELPSREIEFGLVYHAVDLALVLDLESELKRFAYYKNYTFDAKELRKFRTALGNCDQLLTENSLSLGNKSVEGSVKNFIQDFSEFTASLPAHGSSYAVANYITSSPTMKLLDQYSLGALRRILEIYVWLLEGNYTEEEINSYESEREAVLESLPNLILNKEVVEPPPVDAVKPELVLPPVRAVNAQQTHSEKILPNPQSPFLDSTKIHDLINRKRLDKVGVVRDATNIKIAEERQRLDEEKTHQAKQIQKKLEELKVRNTKQ